ncbi:heterokaryon incompatibility protein-domain-containing protein [Xylariaceae sp. FL1651]|nr:heterokaryon incompatibility protein-domain-containing protein [Xylariaceae sp. FL1651]
MALYTHLGPRQTRLLRLYAGQCDSVIACSMVICSLDDAYFPEYVALSYAWGSATPTFDLRIDTTTVSVRSNVFHALQQIRAIQGEIEAIPRDCYWWIDSICINQTDEDEKGQQVAIMGEIYERSKHVVVFLGKPNTDGHLAMEFLSRIAKSEADNVRAVVRQATTDELQALATFFQRSWWTRAWTTQEYILSEELYFICANHYLCRYDFEQAHRSLERYSRTASKYRSVHLANGFIMAGKRRKILRRRYDILKGVGHTLDLPLFDFLVYAGGSAATLGQDCVYSTLGLVTDRAKLNLEIRYDGKECATLFEQLTRSQIMSSGCLDIICFADASPRHTSVQCPSWMPYWPNHKAQTSDHMVWQSFPALASWRKRKEPLDPSQDGAKGSTKLTAGYKASGNTLPAATNDSQPGILFCRAILLKKIKILADTYSPQELNESPRPGLTEVKSESAVSYSVADNQGDEASDNNEWWIKALKYQTQENMWRVIVLNRKDSFLDSIAPPRDYYNDFKWLCFRAIENPSQLKEKTLLWFRCHANILFASHPDSVEIINRLKSTFGCNGVLSDFENQIHHVWINMRKRLFISDDHTWGMATANAAVGDTICILAGCCVPVVVRETEKMGYYQLVGECYLDGVMQGEIFEQEDKPIDQWRTIHLI